MPLRPYQQRAVDDLYDWLRGNDGNPCLVLPTGAGKSHVVAEICKDAVQNYAGTRLLMLTHQKELIEQNYEKLRQHWPNAPVGIYSASVGRRETGMPITFAGIQSVRNKATLVGAVDLVLVDECHLINHRDEGSYRKLMGDLEKLNPNMRVIGLTATPWRLGHGTIASGDALFDDLLEPVTIAELIEGGFLSPLRSKLTGVKYDLTGIHKRGGEYIEAELMQRLDTDEYNFSIAKEICAIGQERRSWLLFCTGVKHALHMAEILRAYGIAVETVTGETSKAERADILERFKRGEIRALTNANVLTTGFDAPMVDLVAMLRPTMSPSLYVQMAGRGMRIAEGKKDCLVLDFAGVVERHGPITAVQPPSRAREGGGDAPVKSCEECWEIVHVSVKVCPSCGTAFPEQEKEEKDFTRRDDDIMGLEAEEMLVTGWDWRVHTARKTGKDMLKVTYYGALSDTPISEYFPIKHDGYAGQKAGRAIAGIVAQSQTHLEGVNGLDSWATALNAGVPPRVITHRRDGKYRRVENRIWQ